jgi:hypothetical protein
MPSPGLSARGAIPEPLSAMTIRSSSSTVEASAVIVPVA